MAIHVKTITRKNKDYKKIKQLYHSAFPRNERLPISFILYRQRKPYADFLSFYENDTFLGLAYVIHYKNAALVFYLAIDDTLRGQGYGSKILDTIKKKYKGRIILEIETLDKQASNYTQRIRRSKFYKKNGFSFMNYSVLEFGEKMNIMTYGGIVTTKEFITMFSMACGKLFYKIAHLKIIRI